MSNRQARRQLGQGTPRGIRRARPMHTVMCKLIEGNCVMSSESLLP